MASISSSKFYVFEQTTPGTNPNAGATNWYGLSVAKPGVSGGPANQTVESQLIRNNRNPAGIKLVGPQSALTIPFETQVPTASTQAFWALLRASIYSSATTASYTTGAATGNSWATTTITIAAGDQANVLANIQIGDVIQIYSAAAATTKYYARVTAVGGGGATLTTDVSSSTGAANDLVIKRGARIKNGTTQQTFGMIREFQAPGSVTWDRISMFPQETVDSCSFSLTNKGIITGTFSTVGVGGHQLATSRAALTQPQNSSTFNDAPSLEVLDATNNCPVVNVAGAEYGVQSVSFSWNNNSQARSNVGDYNATSISVGDFRGTGSFTAYFDNIAEFNKALLGTASSLYVVMENSSKQAITISIPRVRYGNPTLNGQDRDVIATLPFQFEEDPTEAIGVRISYIL